MAKVIGWFSPKVLPVRHGVYMVEMRGIPNAVFARFDGVWRYQSSESFNGCLGALRRAENSPYIMDTSRLLGWAGLDGNYTISLASNKDGHISRKYMSLLKKVPDA